MRSRAFLRSVAARRWKSPSRGLDRRQINAIRRHPWSDSSRFASTLVVWRIPLSIAMPGTKVTPSPFSTIWTSVWSDVPIIEAWALISGVILQAMAILEKKESIFVDRRRIDRAAGGSLARREGNIERIVEQQCRIHFAAVERQCEQHAIELPAVQRLTGGAAALFAKIEFQVRPFAAQPRQHCRQEERRDRRNHAHPQITVKRLPLGGGEFGEFLRLAQDSRRLVGDLLAEGGEAHQPARALDERYAKQCLKLAKPR
jgi:hypothetical protein